MESDSVDESEIFQAISASGARALLIGRRALVALGLPVATVDYDFWLHVDDIESFNGALAPLDHHANATPAEARARGRYVIENGEHIDVMVARAKSTADGRELRFDDAWARKQTLMVADATAYVPCLADLIVTKEWALRAKDIADIQMIEALRRERGES